MADPVRTHVSIARYGLTDDRAGEHLRAAGWWAADNGGGAVKDHERTLVALSRSPDPDLALRTIDRVRSSDTAGWPGLNQALAADRGLRARLFSVLGAFIVANPGEWRRLLTDRQSEPAAYPAALLAAVQDGGAARELRAAYRGLLLEIAAADLAHLIEPDLTALDYQQVTARLTYLAEAALRAALAVAEAEVGAAREDCRLAVIAMGKTGGRELNYVSDVDVLFIADGDLDVATRLASTMMRVATNACFEVDGPQPRRSRQLLQALGPHMGVPGAAEGPSGRRRRRAGPELPRRRAPHGVDGGRPGQLRRRRAGHASPRRGPRAGRAARP